MDLLHLFQLIWSYSSGESPGGMSVGECPDTDDQIEFLLLVNSFVDAWIKFQVKTKISEVLKKEIQDVKNGDANAKTFMKYIQDKVSFGFLKMNCDLRPFAA